jgi:DNA-binding Lrp family transcriptional regulator
MQIRDRKIAQARLQGKTYKQIEKELGISSATVNRALKKTEIKEIIETGTNKIVALIPLAVDVQYQAMTIQDDNSKPTALAVKASENVLKIVAIIPSHQVNQTINNITNQQNNIILSDNVAQALQGLYNYSDQDSIDV